MDYLQLELSLSERSQSQGGGKAWSTVLVVRHSKKQKQNKTNKKTVDGSGQKNDKTGLKF